MLILEELDIQDANDVEKEISVPMPACDDDEGWIDVEQHEDDEDVWNGYNQKLVKLERKFKISKVVRYTHHRFFTAHLFDKPVDHYYLCGERQFISNLGVTKECATALVTEMKADLDKVKVSIYK